MDGRLKEMWDKVCESAVAAGEIAKNTANCAGKKAVEVYNTSKINLKIFDLNTDITLLYKELGRLMYASHCNEEVDTKEVDSRLAEIDEKNKLIEELRAELNAVSNVKKCPDCGKTLTKEDEFCSACGAKL